MRHNIEVEPLRLPANDAAFQRMLNDANYAANLSQQCSVPQGSSWNKRYAASFTSQLMYLFIYVCMHYEIYIRIAIECIAIERTFQFANNRSDEVRRTTG